MVEPIPFFGWFEWFEEQSPLKQNEIIELYKDWSDKISLEYYSIIVKQIEAYHGIK